MGLFKFLKDKFSKKDNKIDKYSAGLSKSRRNFASKLSKLSKKYGKVNEEYFEKLEEILIESDVGVSFALSTIEKVFLEAKKQKVNDPEKINEILIDKLFEDYISKGEVNSDISFSNDSPTVLLVVGVNGVGKTTTIAKLANRYISRGKKVLLVAADTFRAGAKEQLNEWAKRLNIDIVIGKENSDPASVAYDGMIKAKRDKIDLVIVDTAGRLQNKANLMAELAKIKRVIAKEIEGAPQETFLIIDATTGQNGVAQAKAFKEVTDISGIVITKMDGTSKGGIILAIRNELGTPVRFIGLGEKMDDLEEFDLDSYLYGLCVGGEDE
ncbi:MAG: signal recognition particle-docking protein FtsY [Erysipelotrichaceae bacterium]|jgi:fused signal recognition particle receptor|nr:signal recognition particle-docking protein FtsY [Erysipelotrichaceae bacterium]